MPCCKIAAMLFKYEIPNRIEIRINKKEVILINFFKE